MNRQRAVDVYEQDLAELKKQFDGTDAGRWVALSNAVKYCQTVSLPLPEWVALAVLNLIQERHFAPGGNGAYGSTKSRVNMDYAHWLRWSAVQFVVRGHGLREMPEGKRGRPRKNSPPTKAALLLEAAAQMEGKPLARYATLEQIEESYHTVTTSLAAGEARFRFDRFFEL